MSEYIIGTIIQLNPTEYKNVRLAINGDENKAVDLQVFCITDCKKGETIIVKHLENTVPITGCERNSLVFTEYWRVNSGLYMYKGKMDDPKSKTYTEEIDGIASCYGEIFCDVQYLSGCTSKEIALRPLITPEQMSQINDQDNIKLLVRRDLNRNIVGIESVENLTRNIVIKNTQKTR